MSSDASSRVQPQEPTREDRKKQPWKYVGYRDFCEFVASDDDFFVLRRFSVLSARVLLALQDELAELECQLEVHEKGLASTSAPNVHNGTFRDEHSETRLDIIREVDRKLRAYNELVIQHSDLRKRPPVSGKDRNSLSNWFSNHSRAISEEETKYVQNSRDLFAMVPKSKTPLRRFLERSSHFRLFRLWIKASPLEDENVHYTSDQRIDMFVNVIIAMIGTGHADCTPLGIGIRYMGSAPAGDHYNLRRGVLVLRLVHNCGEAIRDAWGCSSVCNPS